MNEFIYCINPVKYPDGDAIFEKGGGGILKCSKSATAKI